MNENAFKLMYCNVVNTLIKMINDIIFSCTFANVHKLQFCVKVRIFEYFLI